MGACSSEAEAKNPPSETVDSTREIPSSEGILYYNGGMDRSESRDRKIMWRIGWAMAGLLVLVLAVIGWQLWQRKAAAEAETDGAGADAGLVVELPPEFTEYLGKIELTRGTAFDLAETARAEGGEAPVEVRVEGEYDLDMAGSYELTYVARSRKGGETRQMFTLEVVEGEPGGVRVLERYFKTKTGFWAETHEGLTYVDGTLIVNKKYGLPEDYGAGLTAEAEQAFEAMQAAAAEAGLNLWVVSGFRSYETQRQLYNRYVARDGQAEADTYSARPGYSEHQTGLALDVNLTDTEFAGTPEGQWLAQNAQRFGFALRYPEGKTEVTGYIFEPWHWRYVGTELAEKLYNGGEWVSLEEYFGLESI